MEAYAVRAEVVAAVAARVAEAAWVAAARVRVVARADSEALGSAAVEEVEAVVDEVEEWPEDEVVVVRVKVGKMGAMTAEAAWVEVAAAARVASMAQERVVAQQEVAEVSVEALVLAKAGETGGAVTRAETEAMMGGKAGRMGLEALPVAMTVVFRVVEMAGAEETAPEDVA